MGKKVLGLPGAGIGAKAAQVIQKNAPEYFGQIIPVGRKQTGVQQHVKLFHNNFSNQRYIYILPEITF